MTLSPQSQPIPLFVPNHWAPKEVENFAGLHSIQILPDFERFNQANDMFSRGFWDEDIKTQKTFQFYRSFVKPQERMRKVEGYAQRDYALRNGPWVVTEMLAEMNKGEDRRDGFTDHFKPYRPPKVEPRPIDDSVAMTAEIKQVAKLYGADLCGVTDFDERWVYATRFTARRVACKPIELPEGLTRAIVIAKSMDYNLIRTTPSATASTAPGLGYAEDIVTLLALAQFIRTLGYQAVACQNDTVLSIPLAIKAGLGEYGRHGMVITEEFGPRVRFGTILTDLPLAVDQPTTFGVTETCQICRRCANNCPPQAIDHGEPETMLNSSIIKGVRKWTTDPEKCFSFWVGQGTDCAICIRTCPYNKDFSKWYFRLERFLLNTPLRRFVLYIDDKLRLHDRQHPLHWWEGMQEDAKSEKRAEDHRLQMNRVTKQEQARSAASDR